jgi:hypothetical protein
MNIHRFEVSSTGDVVFFYLDPAANSPFRVAISCPIPSAMHSEASTLRESHHAWARRFRVLPTERAFERFAATRFDELIAYQSHGWPVESAMVSCNLMTWYFVFDDIMDMEHNLDDTGKRYALALCKRHIELLDGARAEAHEPEVVQAFDDYLHQVRALGGGHPGTDVWYRRMVHHLKEYICGTSWEAAAGPMTASRVNTAMYMQVRHMTVGIEPCFDLMALIAGVSPEPIQGNFYLARLARLAVNHGIWINDLAGLNRDIRCGLANVVFTLQRDHSLSLPEAARMVGRMCDEELLAFEQLVEQLPLLVVDYEQNKAAIDGYVDVLRRWMRGLVDWSARSDRYQRLDVDMSLQTDETIKADARRFLLSA